MVGHDNDGPLSALMDPQPTEVGEFKRLPVGARINDQRFSHRHGATVPRDVDPVPVAPDDVSAPHDVIMQHLQKIAMQL